MADIYFQVLTARLETSLKIGIDARSLLCRYPRGEGNALLELYRAVALQRPQWEYIFFGLKGDKAFQSSDFGIANSRFVQFDLPGFRWNSWENIGLPLMAKMLGVNVLHGFSSGGPMWCPVPFVMTVHDVIPMKFDDGQSAKSTERFRARLTCGLRQAEHVVTVSVNTKNDLLALFPKFESSRASVIYWGASHLGDRERDLLKGRSGPVVPARVLAFGGGAKRKNTGAIVETFSHVLRQEPLSRLTIVGVTSVAEREALAALAGSLGIIESIDLADFVDDKVLDELYRSATCVLYLSLYEGFGLPPLEAMVRGTPVVASNMSSIPEVVGSGGILVDPTDTVEAASAVVKLIRFPAEREAFVEAGRLRAESFSWEDTGKRMASILEQVAR